MFENELKRISAGALRELGSEALASVGVREDIIHPVVDGLLWASLRGIDSHGIRLLPHYVEGVKAGRLNPNPEMLFEQTAMATGTLDADHTLGHAAGVSAMRYAIDLARDSGIAAVSVHNSSHCGALSYFAHAAAEQDMIGIVMTHATARLKTPGGKRSFFGNNPICLVAPMLGEAPFCFDAATSTVTFNKVKAAAAAGMTLPLGLVADAEGYETNDPTKAEQLFPIGDYKGFGLSMVVDILCALLSGMPNGNQVSKMYGGSMSTKRRLGQFYCALRIDAFRDLATFKHDLREMAQRVRNEPTDSVGASVLVPGDPEKIQWEVRMEQGVPLQKHVYEQIKSLSLGID